MISRTGLASSGRVGLLRQHLLRRPDRPHLSFVCYTFYASQYFALRQRKPIRVFALRRHQPDDRLDYVPSLLDPIFPPLIKALPVADHSISVEAEFWQPKFEAAGQLQLWEAIFAGLPSIRISRSRLFNHAYPTPEQKCAEVFLWGYPRDMRGLVSHQLPHLKFLSERADSLKAWPDYFDAFVYPARIGISTITKLAYFHRRCFDGIGALILDLRLIQNTKNWSEVAVPGLSYVTASARYIDYLNVLHAAAKNPRLACAPDQLEFFLFALGDGF